MWELANPGSTRQTSERRVTIRYRIVTHNGRLRGSATSRSGLPALGTLVQFRVMAYGNSRKKRPAPRVADEPTRPRGRPRSTAAHDAILSASLDLIRESGYDSLAIEAIAERAGVAKTTVYRRWATKELIVVEAIERIVLGVAIPDTGSVEQDVLALMDVTRRMYADVGTTSLLPALVATMARSKPVAKAVRAGMATAWNKAMSAVLQRGIARGALRADANVTVALELLAGPLFYRYLWLGTPMSETYVKTVVSAVMDHLRAPD